MSTPVAVIADALIAFILSLLRDPDAVEGFTADPQAAMMQGGVQDACLADVRAVTPVIVDHPSVTPNPPGPPGPPDPPTPPGPPDPVVNEIIRLVSQFTTVDNRSTIVDQSVNQNIWTEGGDVTQVFDQEAVVASGDEAVAAGDDATVTNSDTDITTGDVSIGNEEYDNSFNEDGSDNSTVDDSFQDNSTNDSSDQTTVDDSVQDNSTDVEVAVDDSTVAESDVAVTPPPEPVAAAMVDEPADVLESDMTAVAEDDYEADAASATAEEPVLEDAPAEQ
ncbi:MAG: IniB N-terminal domain-containing protein [Microbacteriaceae bacterium]|uniref:IniB N-terminal domain-containing protein n=1 Tax=Microbacterium gubbeenense TaxID=159896 RepID=UPI003F95F606